MRFNIEVRYLEIGHPEGEPDRGICEVTVMLGAATVKTFRLNGNWDPRNFEVSPDPHAPGYVLWYTVGEDQHGWCFNVETEKAYKAVFSLHPRLESYGAVGKLNVEYVPGKFVSSKYGPLLVFDTLKNITQFCGRGTMSQIWECEVVNPRPVTRLVAEREDVPFIVDVQDWWRNEPGLYRVIPAPEGTLACDAVKLVRKVG